MGHEWRRFLRRLFRKRHVEIDPHEVFIDATNLPSYDEDQFEGRIEHPISKRMITAVSVVFVVVALIFTGRLWFLQVNLGSVYAEQSEENRLRQTLLFSERGVIYDRHDVELAWNQPNLDDAYARRAYIEQPGFAHLIGYIGYPERDSSGFFYRTEYVGKDGTERLYDETLAGDNGIKLVEINAHGEVISESVARLPTEGDDVRLSIDAGIQAKASELIAELSDKVGFRGGALAMMDIDSGELIALTSFPEYDLNVLSDGGPEKTISRYVQSESKPFLNRPVAGLYTPGSIIKPFIAIAALEEEVIPPEKTVNSTGALVIPNPYFPDKPSIFRDWKAHGLVDLRRALAVSSDQYFYVIGGGFEDQAGLGIDRISKYLNLFGFGEETGIAFPGELPGTIPTPEWKKQTFGEDWLLGNTYHTAIGQYGFQSSVLQVLRAIASLGNGGTLVTPVIEKGAQGETERLSIDFKNLNIVREGMRRAVTDSDGTARGLNTSYVDLAAKTGTAELGAEKNFVNSWAVGFFPYENPRYAFVVMMEHGPVRNLVGGVSIMRQLLDWMRDNSPLYFAI